MLIRDLHPSRELAPYDVIPSWGGYAPLRHALVQPDPSIDQAAVRACVQQQVADRRRRKAERMRAVRRQASLDDRRGLSLRTDSLTVEKAARRGRRENSPNFF